MSVSMKLRNFLCCASDDVITAIMMLPASRRVKRFENSKHSDAVARGVLATLFDDFRALQMNRLVQNFQRWSHLEGCHATYGRVGRASLAHKKLDEPQKKKSLENSLG